MRREKAQPSVGVIQPRLDGYGGFEKYGAHLIEALARCVPVEVITENQVDVPRIERAFDVCLQGVRFHCDPRCNPGPAGGGRLQSWWNRRQQWLGYQEVTRRYDLLVAQTISLPWASSARRSVMVSHGPVVQDLRLDPAAKYSALDALLRSDARAQRDVRRRLESWTGVVANSQFTRGWLKALWGQEARVINPPIPLPEQPTPGGKRPWIVGVGFLAPSSNPEQDPYSLKRHELLIQCFRQLCDAGLSGWELHLAGHMVQNDEARAYLRRLQQSAEGYSVHFHPNLPHAEMAELLYRHASIYWHAAGFGLGADAPPGRVESFGMSTAEAMSWGMVPVVIRNGGLPEVVQHGRTGYLWDTLEELCTLTRRLVTDPVERERMAAEAIRAARQFGLDRFQHEVAALLQDELAALGCRQ